MKCNLLFILLLLSQAAFPHGGGLDKNGGHNDRKNGGYHCHKSHCFNARAQVNKATQDAVAEKREFSGLYNRKEWKHWSDFDGDCMNTRHEILKAQADGPIKLSRDGCYVSKGVWNDSFSGKKYTKPSDLDVDHIIPLKWANGHGGSVWSAAKKERFANDPINLLAVDDGLNQSKGAKGPDEWMPPNHSYRCEYLRVWKAVLSAYPSLRMAASEARIFKRQLGACES